MNAKKQIDKAKLIKWSALIKEQSESSLKIKDWCAQNDITKDTYYYWKRKVMDALIDSATPDIVPIAPESSESNVIDSELSQDSLGSTDLRVSHKLYNPATSTSKSVSRELYNLSNPHENTNSISISSKGICVELPSTSPTELITGIIEVLCHA